MDLIYQNAERTDQGVMKHYEMDLAYGRDENDFVLTIDADAHCLLEDYILYMEGTEYGGIVDAIESSNIDDTVIYSGRTWHGILEGKVFEPEEGQEFLVLDGKANEVLQYLLEKWELTDLFTVPKEESLVEIADYKIGYEKGYTGLRKMLFEFGGKLHMSYKGDKVVISAEPYQDYSEDEEFDSSQVYFTIKKNYRPVNHLICRGTGKQGEVYVIHLFMDEYGGMQSYTKSENPILDTDYRLKKEDHCKKLFGKDEVTDTIDCGNVQARENYVILTAMPSDWEKDADTWNDVFTDIYTLDEEGKFVQSQAKEKTLYELQKVTPSDWKENYSSYYVKDEEEESSGEGDGYKKATFEKEDVYTPQTKKPDDWEENFSEYYYQDGDKYKKVQPVIKDNYIICNIKPPGWDLFYKNFYEKHSDGINITYEKVNGVTKYRYKKQTSKPSDWEENYSSYYRKSGKKYVENSPQYQKQNKKPENWQRHYSEYYQRITDGTEVSYRQISAVTKNSYELQTQKPSDWENSYNSYYEKNEKGKYVAVTIKNYVALMEKPADWNKKYAEYFYIYSDGTKEEYRSIAGVQKDNYILQTSEPSDWSSNYDGYYYLDGSDYKKVAGIKENEEETAPVWAANSYYTKQTVTTAPEYTSFSKVYRKGDAPKWKKEIYYTKKSEQKAPSYDSVKPVYAVKTPRWNACARYSRITVEVAPEWKMNTYYVLSKTEEVPSWKKSTYYTLEKTVNPVWAENTFYTKVKKMVAPLWSDAAYYRKFLDHYAGLVEKGKEYSEKIKRDELSISLEPDTVYDINDIVGAKDNITKQSVWMPITKKIVKITETTETVEYEVGE